MLHVARLARLALSEEEVERFSRQLSGILEHAERVMALVGDDVPPTAHAVAFRPPLRPDEPGECLTQEGALASAPEAEDGRFAVPRMMEDPA